MAKARTTYYCQNCGTSSAKWVGKCPACHQWNTMVEEVVSKEEALAATRNYALRKVKAEPVPILEVERNENPRLPSGDSELDRVLGGGIVHGSVILVGGEPGIGKSTLLLQLALRLNNTRILYVAGEESEQQIRLRADRIGIANQELFLLAETNTQAIFKQADALLPSLIIVDSVQTLYTVFVESPPGSVSQIRECAAEVQRYAKENNIPVFLIGHINKDGMIAGPKVLEHIVDVVLQFEGDRNYTYRLLRTIKNRFGSTAEIGIYEMQGEGLQPVLNPSEMLVTGRSETPSGIAVACMMEGMRPFLIEAQALVTPAFYGTPQRTATGFDARRLAMLLAVLEKRLGFKFGTKDVFMNIAGGLKVDDPGIDLAVVAALLSSYEDQPLAPRTAFAAEVGLSGEIRAVNRIEQRISEAEKLGYDRIIISAYQKTITGKGNQMAIHPVSKVSDLLQILF